jgi:hypothetical protein
VQVVIQPSKPDLFMLLIAYLLFLFVANASSTKILGNVQLISYMNLLLGIVAANLQTFNEFSLCWVDPSSGSLTYISNLTTVGGIFPVCAFLR